MLFSISSVPSALICACLAGALPSSSSPTSAPHYPHWGSMPLPSHHTGLFSPYDPGRPEKKEEPRTPCLPPLALHCPARGSLCCQPSSEVLPALATHQQPAVCPGSTTHYLTLCLSPPPASLLLGLPLPPLPEQLSALCSACSVLPWDGQRQVLWRTASQMKHPGTPPGSHHSLQSCQKLRGSSCCKASCAEHYMSGGSF